jgi:IS6 family transposase
MDETYVKVNGRWAYLYRATDSRKPHCRFTLLPGNSKAVYRFLGKILNNVKKRQILRSSTRQRPPANALLCSNAKAGGLSDVEHRQIKYRNNGLNAIMAN